MNGKIKLIAHGGPNSTRSVAKIHFAQAGENLCSCRLNYNVGASVCWTRFIRLA